MKSVSVLLAVSFCLFQAVAALSLDLGVSYCLTCAEKTNGDIYTGLQGNCRGVSKGCNFAGANCRFCKIERLEVEDYDLLQEYCSKGSGSNSISHKYRVYEVDTVNMSNCDK